MNKLVTIVAICLAIGLQAQSWKTTITPVTVDGIRIDYIGLTVSPDMTARGVMSVSKLNGTNPLARASVQLTPAAISNILASCGTTLPQLGYLLLRTGGLTNANEFVTRSDIFVDPRTGKARVLITTISNQRRVIDEAVINAAMTQAGGSVEIFQDAFLDYAKANTR